MTKKGKPEMGFIERLKHAGCGCSGLPIPKKQGETVWNIPVAELPKMVLRLLDYTLERGVRYAAATLEPEHREQGEASRPKNSFEVTIDETRFNVLVEILAWDFEWHDDFRWGATGIKMELIRRAKAKSSGSLCKDCKGDGRDHGSDGADGTPMREWNPALRCPTCSGTGEDKG